MPDEYAGSTAQPGTEAKVHIKPTMPEPSVYEEMVIALANEEYIGACEMESVLALLKEVGERRKAEDAIKHNVEVME
jgi:hypothetical protein